MSSPPSAPPLPPFLDRASSGHESLPPPPPKNRWKAVGAIVVVVILLVALIFISGILPRPHSTTATPTFSSAQQAANSAAGGYSGGGWQNIIAVAIATNQTTILTRGEIEAEFGATDCAVAWASSAPAAVSIPLTPSNAATGGSGAWFFIYANSTASLLLVEVTNGSAQVLFTATGTDCADIATAVAPLSATTIVDSSTAVAAANAKGGSSYLQQNPSANRTWLVVGQVFVLAPFWSVAYSACPLPPPANSTLNRTEFLSTVDAQTGTALTGGNVSTNCSLPEPAQLEHLLVGLGPTASGFAGASQHLPGVAAGPVGRAPR